MSDEEVYKQICENIRFTDDISFKLLGLVPLVSGISIVSILLKSDGSWFPGIFLLSLFGALVTLGLYRWELRNIKTCINLIEFASNIESHAKFKQYMGKWDAPTLFSKKIGKTEAEKFVYTITIISWLVLPWIKYDVIPISIYSIIGAILYFLLIFIILLILFFSYKAKMRDLPDSKSNESIELIKKIKETNLSTLDLKDLEKFNKLIEKKEKEIEEEKTKAKDSSQT